MNNLKLHITIRAVSLILCYNFNSLLSAQEVNSLFSDNYDQEYKIVKAGNQLWMDENLKSIQFNNGEKIPLVTSSEEWASLITPAYCWYANDSATYGNVYGALYNWYAVETGKLCPNGWHVPSDSEWTALSNYLGGDNFAGEKLKEKGITHWLHPNSKATNESGFTALPGGNRNFEGTFFNLGHNGYWWTSTEATATNALNRYLFYNNNNIIGFSHMKKYGFSVRCIKD